MSTSAPEAPAPPKPSTFTSILQGAADFAALLETAGSVGKNLIGMLAPNRLSANFESNRIDLGGPTLELTEFLAPTGTAAAAVGLVARLGLPSAVADPRDETPLGSPLAAIEQFKSATTEVKPPTEVTPKSTTKRAPAKKAPAKAPAKATGSTGNTRGVTVNGRKADGSLDLRTKEGRALKAAEDAAAVTTAPPKAPAKKAPAKKALAKKAAPAKAPAKAAEKTPEKAPAANAPEKEKTEAKTPAKAPEKAAEAPRARRPLAAVPTATPEPDKAASAV